jgi:hypothetical protein
MGTASSTHSDLPHPPRGMYTIARHVLAPSGVFLFIFAVSAYTLINIVKNSSSVSSVSDCRDTARYFVINIIDNISMLILTKSYVLCSMFGCAREIYCTSESELWLDIARVGRSIFTSQRRVKMLPTSAISSHVSFSRVQ